MWLKAFSRVSLAKPLFEGIEYWQNPDPASAANTVECAADGEDPNCSASIPSEGIDVAHTIVRTNRMVLLPPECSFSA